MARHAGEDALDLPLAAMREALAQGRTDPLALAETALARIEAAEPELHAWAHVDPEAVRAAARRLDDAPSVGPLHGVPVGMKDCFDTADMPTSYGSEIYAGFQPRADAACVAMLRAAGAIVVGKTALTEFAAPYPGPTRNPVNPAHTPGGSSSGSAAAVAAGMVPVALGSQTMGSLLRPASYCGVVAYKPSWGLIPTSGMKAQVPDYDHVGVMARRLDDAVATASVLTGLADDGATAEHPPRIAVFRGPQPELAEPAAREALDRAAARCAAAGAEVTEMEMHPLLVRACDAQMVMTWHDMARSLVWEWHTRRDRISPLLRGFLEQGWAIGHADYAAARDAVAEARAAVADLFGPADIVMGYSAPGEAPRGLGSTGDTVFNRLWTVLRLPAITLPSGTGPNGLPLGVSLVGRFEDDARLIIAARWCERQFAQG